MSIHETRGNRILNKPALLQLKDKKKLVGAEIGVANGDTSYNICNTLDIQKLYLIDPYDTKCNSDVAFPYPNANEMYLYAKKILVPFINKIEWIIDTSEEAASAISDGLYRRKSQV